jgi:hypothetical protein
VRSGRARPLALAEVSLIRIALSGVMRVDLVMRTTRCATRCSVPTT